MVRGEQKRVKSNRRAMKSQLDKHLGSLRAAGFAGLGTEATSASLPIPKDTP